MSIFRSVKARRSWPEASGGASRGRRDTWRPRSARGSCSCSTILPCPPPPSASFSTSAEPRGGFVSLQRVPRTTTEEDLPPSGVGEQLHASIESKIRDPALPAATTKAAPATLTTVPTATSGCCGSHSVALCRLSNVFNTAALDRQSMYWPRHSDAQWL